MTPPIKYSLELLKNFCYEKQVKLGKNYDDEELFGSTKIVYYCTNCNNENIKSFTFLIKRNTLCKRCVTIESLEKQKVTMLAKYGFVAEDAKLIEKLSEAEKAALTSAEAVIKKIRELKAAEAIAKTESIKRVKKLSKFQETRGRPLD